MRRLALAENFHPGTSLGKCCATSELHAVVVCSVMLLSVISPQLHSLVSHKSFIQWCIKEFHYTRTWPLVISLIQLLSLIGLKSLGVRPRLFAFIKNGIRLLHKWHVVIIHPFVAILHWWRSSSIHPLDGIFFWCSSKGLMWFTFDRAIMNCSDVLKLPPVVSEFYL